MNQAVWQTFRITNPVPMKYDSDAGVSANYFVVDQNGIFICSMQNISQAYLLKIRTYKWYTLIQIQAIWVWIMFSV